ECGKYCGPRRLQRRGPETSAPTRPRGTDRRSQRPHGLQKPPQLRGFATTHRNFPGAEPATSSPAISSSANAAESLRKKEMKTLRFSPAPAWAILKSLFSGCVATNPRNMDHVLSKKLSKHRV